MLEEDQRSNPDGSTTSRYATTGRLTTGQCNSVQEYGFHRTLPHTVISGIPKCKCKSCNMNRFKTGVIKQKDLIVPAGHRNVDEPSHHQTHTTPNGVYHTTSGSHHTSDEDYDTEDSQGNLLPDMVPNKSKVVTGTNTLKQHCETQFTCEGTITVTKSPGKGGKQVKISDTTTYISLDYDHGTEDGSSTTSASYDMSDVMNDSHWNIREAVSKDSVV